VTETLPVSEAIRIVAADRGLLLDKVRELPEDVLVERYLVGGTAIGDHCESLRDLVSHVLMWDEINLAVLAEARRGRSHWSLDERWEAPDVGRLLNRGGVAAGRLVPVDLLLHRFTAVRDALLDELTRLDEAAWTAPVAVDHERAVSLGALIQYVMTTPTVGPYRHAAFHLGLLAS
jgi:DinB superfamily